MSILYNEKRKGPRTKIGDVFTNIAGEVATVLEVISSSRIIVKFQEDQTISEFKQQALEEGYFKNRNSRVIYGVGYIGYGKYNTGRNIRIYKVWQSMLQRCYDKQFQIARPTYTECLVAEDWHNFQNFASWYYSRSNYKDGIKLHLDKDLLVKGNKVYSEETCTLLPPEINNLLPENKASRGDLPVGVIWHKRDAEYRAQMTKTVNGVRRNIHIKSSNDPITCFIAYKEAKEQHFKDMALMYIDSLEPIAFDALMTREVCITD